MHEKALLNNRSGMMEIPTDQERQRVSVRGWRRYSARPGGTAMPICTTRSSSRMRSRTRAVALTMRRLRSVVDARLPADEGDDPPLFAPALHVTAQPGWREM